MAKIRQLEEQAKVAAASPPASPPRRRRTISSASRSGKQWANRLEVEAGSTDKGKSPEVAGQGAFAFSSVEELPSDAYSFSEARKVRRI